MLKIKAYISLARSLQSQVHASKGLCILNSCVVLNFNLNILSHASPPHFVSDLYQVLQICKHEFITFSLLYTHTTQAFKVVKRFNV